MNKLYFILAGLLLFAGLTAGDFIRDGKTSYVIVIPDQEDTGVTFASQELQTFLKKASGADFPIVKSSQAPAKNRIFLGISTAALKILKNDPRNNLKQQEHVVQTIGTDLFLYGQGTWGEMWAVYDYLENVLGYRWYDARGGMKVPDCHNLPWKKLDRKTAFSIPFRSATGYWIYHRPYAHLFFLRNRQNGALITRFLRDKKIFIPEIEINSSYGTHTIPSYIPGTANRNVYKPFPWLKDKNYWKTNPEFFGMLPNGKRSGGGHLCFTNVELRKELTKNVLENMKREPQNRIFSLSAHDSPGRFCHCKPCLAMEKKYGSIGGPYYDYLLELSKILKKQYPANSISFLVYRKNQTQKPPTNLKKLPDNLIPIFAPIDDDFGKSWAHKNNEETCKDLETWGKLASKVNVWYYPNPYSGDITPPLGNIRRLVYDIRKMVKSNMYMSAFEHNVGVCNMIGFTELQSFLILQLFKDVNQDAEKLIDEFMAFEYGKAAPVMRKYLAELEDAAEKNKLRLAWNPTLNAYTYLTAENMMRWYNYFLEMEKILKDDPERLNNVNRVRLNLEYVILMRYNVLLKKYPDFPVKPEALAKTVLARFQKTIDDYYGKSFTFRAKTSLKSLNERIKMALIQAGKTDNNLPESIAKGVDPDQIIQTMPKVNGRDWVKDPDAAWGVAAVLMDKPKPTLPLQVNMYDIANKKYHPSISWIRKQHLGPKGKYKFYKLHSGLTISPDCTLMIGSDSWTELRANLGEAYEMGSLNKVCIYASLKFEGPTYYPEDAGKKDKVICDRIVIIKIK